MALVAELETAILAKETAIRRRAAEILSAIDDELNANQKKPFKFHLPNARTLRKSGRLDASTYDRPFQSVIHKILSYSGGTETPRLAGFEITPGPSLENKLLGTRIDSDEPQPGFYTLLLPNYISIYGTINRLTYLGTRKPLPILKPGDVLIGEAGFHKGRSTVLVQAPQNCTTNAHGLVVRRQDGNLEESIFFRCIFEWYRNNGLVDLLAVGGSGGHFSPEYFELLALPVFPEGIKKKIAKLYSNGRAGDVCLEPGEIVSGNAELNSKLGVWELQETRKRLLDWLAEGQNAIIEGRSFSD